MLDRTLNVSVTELHNSKMAARGAFALVRIGLLAHAFANWTVLAIEEVLLSMCWYSRGIFFRFNDKK